MEKYNILKSSDCQSHQKVREKVTAVPNDIEVIEVSIDDTKYEVFPEQEYGEVYDYFHVNFKDTQATEENDETEFDDYSAVENVIEEQIECDRTSIDVEPMEVVPKDEIEFNDGNENTVDSDPRNEITSDESIIDETVRRETNSVFVDANKLVSVKCSVCKIDSTSGQVVNEKFVCENCCKVKLEFEPIEPDWNYSDLNMNDETQMETGDKENSPNEVNIDDENSVKILILPDDKYQCVMCSKIYCKKKSIIDHVKNHNKKVFACNICKSNFRSKDQLKTHKKRHVRKSLNNTLIYCELCKKYFKTKKGFAYHQQNICVQYKCYICDERFLVNSVLEDHMKTMHDVKKKIPEEAATINENETVMSVCPVCGKIVTQMVLPRHMILHSADKPFTCDLCGKSFKRKHSLQDHIMTEMGMKNFVCDICGMKFLKQGYLNKHVRYHKLNNGEFQGFKCEMCGKKFPEKWRLGVHQRAVHKGGKFASCKCDICGSQFAERWMVRLHKHREHNGEEFKEYQCNVCGKKFLEKWMIRSHQRTTHKGGTKKMYCDLCGRSDHLPQDCSHRHALQEVVCVLCGELFSSTYFLKEHVVSKHNFDKSDEISEDMKTDDDEMDDVKKNVLYICAGCGTNFINKQQLKAHEINGKCIKESKFECEYCGKVYHSKSSLINHLMSHKKASIPALYKCELCLKEFVTPEAWENHMSLDKICLICDKVYPCNDQLKNHVYAEHNEDESKEKKQRKLKGDDVGNNSVINTGNAEKPYECRLCGKRFAQKQAMKNHLFAEMNLRRYVCEFCDKSYNYYSHLKEHIVTNHGEKEFVCGYCGKDFPTKKRFRDHVTLHKDDKPFSCECGLSFKLVRYLSKHKKRCKTFGNRNSFQTEFVEGLNTASELDYTSTELPKRCNICNVICSDDVCDNCSRQKTENYMVTENVVEVTQSINSEIGDKNSFNEYERFIVQYNKTGIKYMQCDKCQFICRPLVNIFEKHYRTHFGNVESEESQEAVAEQVDSRADSMVCEFCSKTFATKMAYLAHVKIHKDKTCSCNVCGLTFKNRFFLKTHSKLHPTQKPSFMCNLCGKTFKTKSGYTHHRSNVCVQYKCEICDEVFLVKSVLQDHLKKVHGIKDVQISGETPKKEQATSVCPICGKMVTENALSRHINLHSEDKPYICDLCGKHFRIKWSLREHIMIEIGMKDYVCEVCGKKFVIQAYLNKHMRFHMMCEGKFEGYQCEICGKKYAEEWKVKEHQRNSHKGKNMLRYKCDICDKKYTRKWLVRSHKRTAHKDHMKEYQCNFCEKKFSEKWIIKLHLQTVHNVNNNDDGASSSDVKATSDELEKLLEYNQRISCDEGNQIKSEMSAEKSRKKSFECELCGKLFATKQGMKNHLYAELNLRKYVCEICGKRYNWWMGLKEHSIMNHGEKEFVCAFCGKDFPTKKRCKDHLSVHSDDRPYNCKCGNSFKLRRYLAKHQKRCGKMIKKEIV